MSDPNDFDAQSIQDYWMIEAEEDLQVAGHLMNSGDYSYALFFGHLTVEKTLKALYIKRHRQHAPRIHNLARLAALCGLELSEIRADQLDLITSFNLEARYPDEKKTIIPK